MTAHQSCIFTDVEEKDRKKLEQIIKKHSLPLSEEVSTVRRWSIACVALPTCGLAITESERVLPELMDELEKELEQLGLQKEWFTVRMTGCPNGCARPYNAEIGLVGKAKGKYTVFVGGSRLGTRLAFIHKDMVPLRALFPRSSLSSSPSRIIAREKRALAISARAWGMNSFWLGHPSSQRAASKLLLLLFPNGVLGGWSLV